LRAVRAAHKSNVQRWITECKRKKGELSRVDCGEGEIDKVCGMLRKKLKRLRVFYDISQFMGERVSKSDTDELREIVRSLHEIIDKKG
jgi:hypothetical protein